MSIERALIKFKGDVRAAADYILAGAPLQPPKYVLKNGYYHPLIESELFGFQASENPDLIKDGETFIKEEDLADFNFFYPFHVDFEEDLDIAAPVKELIHRFEEKVLQTRPNILPTALGPVVPEVFEFSSKKVKYNEFEPFDVAPFGNQAQLFTFHYRSENGAEKAANMTLEDAQLYLERNANYNRKWKLLGWLPRYIKNVDTDRFTDDQYETMIDFKENNSLQFGKSTKQWDVQLFVEGTRYNFEDTVLYSEYDTIDDLYTWLNRKAEELNNPSVRLLIFQMVENSVAELFLDDGKLVRDRERRALNIILGTMILKEDLPPLDKVIGDDALKILYRDQ